MSPAATVHVTAAGEVSIVTVAGDLTADRSRWRAQLEACIGRAGGEVVIDLAGVEDWDPVAQAVLFHVTRDQHARGRRLSIVGLTGSMRRLAHASGMEALLVGPKTSDDDASSPAPGHPRERQHRAREQDGTGSSGWD